VARINISIEDMRMYGGDTVMRMAKMALIYEIARDWHIEFSEPIPDMAPARFKIEFTIDDVDFDDIRRCSQEPVPQMGMNEYILRRSLDMDVAYIKCLNRSVEPGTDYDVFGIEALVRHKHIDEILEKFYSSRKDGKPEEPEIIGYGLPIRNIL